MTAQLTLWETPALRVVLADYRLILISSSAGKDSLFMLLTLVDQARAEGVLDRVVVVHADMGEMDWPGTRELAERQARRLGVRFEVATRTQNDLLFHVLQHGMWPSLRQRWCTSDHKRGPLGVLLTRLVNEVYAAEPDRTEPVRVLSCMGMRAAESRARAKRPPLRTNTSTSNGRRIVVEWLPIHQATTKSVFEGIAAAGAELHPAYALGQSRASCVLCVLNHDPGELARAATHNVELAQLYELVERRIQHRFRADLSMADVLCAARIPPLPDAWPLEAIFAAAPPARATAAALAVLRGQQPPPVRWARLCQTVVIESRAA